MPTYNCDICGMETYRVYKRKVAGALVDVCENCSDLGEKVHSQRKRSQSASVPYSNTQRFNSTYQPSGSGSSRPRTHSGRSVSGVRKTGNKFVDFKIVDNYTDILLKLRSREQMSVKEFARTLVVKDNYYKRIEKGTTMLPIDLAQKIEKQYQVKLLESVEDEEEEDLSNFMKKGSESGESMIYFRKRGEKPKYD